MLKITYILLDDGMQKDKANGICIPEKPPKPTRVVISEV